MKYAARDRKTHKFIPEYSRHPLDLGDFTVAALYDSLPEVKRNIILYYRVLAKYNKKHEHKIDVTFDIVKLKMPDSK